MGYLLLLCTLTASALELEGESLDLPDDVNPAALADYKARMLTLSGVTVADPVAAMVAINTVTTIDQIVTLDDIITSSWAVFEGSDRRALTAWQFAEQTGDAATSSSLQSSRRWFVGLGSLALLSGASLIALPALSDESPGSAQSMQLIVGGAATAVVGVTGITWGLRLRRAPVSVHYTTQRASALVADHNEALRTSLALSEEATFGLDLSIDRAPSSMR